MEIREKWECENRFLTFFFYNITKIYFEDPGNNGFELLERHSLVWILSLSVLHHEQFINLGISFENCQTHFFKEKKKRRKREKRWILKVELYVK